MNQSSNFLMPWRLRLSLCAALVCGTAPAYAQQDAEWFASAVVQLLAPATDDPDALLREQLAQAMRIRQSPLAGELVAAAIALVDQIQDAERLVPLVAAAQRSGPWHGSAASRLHELAWQLETAARGPAAPDAGPGPYPHHAREWLCIGPFGDDGDDAVGVVYVPELEFPPPGVQVAGRTGPVQTRVVRRTPAEQLVDFADPRRPAPGTYYGLHRMAVAAATQGQLEIECWGSWQVFVDGREVARGEPWRSAVPRFTYVTLQLAAGEHTTLVKTADNDRHRAGLRWLDAAGEPLAGVTELPASAPLPTAVAPSEPIAKPSFPTAVGIVAAAARSDTATPALRIAALWTAVRNRHVDLALEFAELLEASQPTAADERLALAVAIADLELPDDLKAARARALVEAAAHDAPPAHHTARLERAQLLAQQDRHEDALRLLLDHPAPGPATFSERHSLLRKLSFTAEYRPNLLAWRQACPRDPRPLDELAELAENAGQMQVGLELRRTAAELRPASGRFGSLLRRLADCGEVAAARQLLDRDSPPPLDPATPPSNGRLQHELHLAWRARDQAAARAVVAQLLAHPTTDPRIANYTALVCLQLELPALAVDCWRHSLQLDSDQPRVIRALAAHGGAAPPGADFTAFRRDGAALRAAFVVGEREATAPTTTLLDQRIVEVAPDGSALIEVHELHRINDQSGVDAFRTVSTATKDDEVWLVRSIAADGTESVPPKVDGDYAMARLEPGAFVEIRYRTRQDAPGADALRIGRHAFRSDDAPVVCSELVLILPNAPRGELRGRELPAAARELALADGRRAWVYTATDQARLPQERFTPATGALVPCAEFGADQPPFGTWRSMRQGFWWRTQPLAPVRAIAARLFADRPDPAQRLATAYAYVQRELESGSSRTATEALLHRKGDRFLALAGLLQAGNVPVLPVACRDHRPELGDGDAVLFATGDTFDTLAMQVQLPSGPVFVFQDAPRHWPLGAVPAARGGTDAIVLHDDHCATVVLPTAAAANNHTRGVGTATLVGSDLQIQLELEVGDVAGFGIAEQLRQQKQDVQKLAARQIATQLLAGWRVQQAELTSEPGSAFRLRARARRSAGQRDGELLLVPMPMPPMKLMATLGDRAERNLPFRLPMDVWTEFTVTLDLGETAQLAEVPAPVHVAHAGLVFDQQCHLEGRKLVLRRFTRVHPTQLPPSDFAGWLRALAAVDALDQTSLRCRSTQH